MDTLQVKTHQLGDEGPDNEDSIPSQSFLLLALSNELQLDSELLLHGDMCLLLIVEK